MTPDLISRPPPSFLGESASRAILALDDIRGPVGAKAVIWNGLVITCIPGLRCPLPIAAIRKRPLPALAPIPTIELAHPADPAAVVGGLMAHVVQHLGMGQDQEILGLD
jgi:hypothetical protein